MDSGSKIMHKQLFSLAIIGFVSLAGSQSASAREGGARFNYAPNTYSLEGPVVRRAAEPMHSVKSGSVPRGSSFLGVDPQMLTKAPPAPVPQLVPQAVPQTTAQVMPKHTPFDINAFGKPISAPPPVIAQAPPPSVAPMAAAAKALTPPVIANKPVTSRRPAANRSGTRSTRDVHGVLTSHKQKSPDGLQAIAGRGLDSYGKNVGYVPGPYLPQGTGDGVRTEANVSGRIIR